MVTTNFTVKGSQVKVLAYLDMGSPVFSLEIGHEVIADGIDFKQLKMLADSIIEELNEIRKPYLDAGSKIQNFSEMWSMKEEADADDQ